MTLEEMQEACEEAAYAVDDVAKYRDIRTSECAEAIKRLAEVVRELVRREAERTK
jgi:hypothetical protein